jgi:hypothetical protein
MQDGDDDIADYKMRGMKIHPEQDDSKVIPHG